MIRWRPYVGGLLAALAVLAPPALAGDSPAPGGKPDVAALLAQATARRAASDLRQSDSLVWLAMGVMRTRPPRSPRERRDWLAAAIACARPVTDAHIDSLRAWIPQVMSRPASDLPGAALEEAWFVAGRAWQNAARRDSAVVCLARAVSALRARPGHTPAEEASLLARAAMLDLASARTRDMARDASEALTAWHAAPGGDSLVLAFARLPLARVRAEAGRVDSARADLELARAILVSRLGPDHGELIHLWRTIAAVRSISDDPRAALPAVEEALRITTLTRPAGDPEFINQYAQASSLASGSGDVVAACRYGRMGLAAAEGRYGRTHSMTTNARLALANSLRHMGDLSSALEQAREAVDVQQKLLTPTDGERAYGLSVLASVELAMHDFAAAYDHYSQSAALREAILGPDHASTLYSRSAQAEAAVGLRRFDEAERLLRRVALEQEANGPGDQVADTWLSLAAVQMARGHADSALTTMNRVVAMADTVWGEESETFGIYRTNRLAFLRAAGRPGEAFDEAIALSALSRQQLRWATSGASEREALAAAEKRSEALSAAVELAVAPGAPPDAASRAWEEVARSRALVFRVQAERRERRSARGEAVIAFARVDSARAALAHELLDPGAGGAPARRELRDSLRRTVEEVERELAERVPARQAEGPGSALAAARSALAPFERLVAFERYHLMSADTAAVSGELTVRFAYAAFVAGRTGRVRAIGLGDAERIEERVARWNALVTRGAHGAEGEVSLAGRTRVAGVAVRHALWDPIAPLVADAPRVDLVCDGATANVDFGALPLASGAYLLEKGPLLAPLASEEDLRTRAHEGRGMLALGAPDFDRGGSGGVLLAASVERSGIPDSLRLRFGSLRESGIEAGEAAAAWSAAHPGEGAPALLQGARAGEAQVRADAPSCAVLHLATHAFMVDGQPSAATAADPGERGVGAIVESPAARRALAGSVDWTVAGLALAGANTSGPESPAADDGYLTGAELAALDLSRVRCAVLSACRTGAAQADRFESLQGLERALRLAGVGEVVMSLWPVDDGDAREWMRAFYGAWLKPGASVAQAVRAADLERLHALRAAGADPRPARWAPFFARGERE